MDTYEKGGLTPIAFSASAASAAVGLVEHPPRWRSRWWLQGEKKMALNQDVRYTFFRYQLLLRPLMKKRKFFGALLLD